MFSNIKSIFNIYAFIYFRLDKEREYNTSKRNSENTKSNQILRKIKQKMWPLKQNGGGNWVLSSAAVGGKGNIPPGTINSPGR